MSGDHHIEFGAGVQYVGHAGIGQAVFILEAHVEHAQQHVILSLDGVDDFARLLQRVRHRAIRQVGRVPAGDARRDHADDGDAHAALFKDGIAVGDGSAVFIGDIAGEHFAVHVGDGLANDVHAVVVLVVAGDPDVIVQGVDGLDHGCGSSLPRKMSAELSWMVSSASTSRVSSSRYCTMAVASWAMLPEALSAFRA